MSEHKMKSHNKTLLLYQMVFPLKYRKRVIADEVGRSLKDIYHEILDRYEIDFVEIGYGSDHVQFFTIEIHKKICLIIKLI